MDQRKILIVNLSRGLVGEDNAALLGSLLVTKIQLAAMSRADIDDVDNRVPFYLYVDEFQNFATDSFATILSEARKYGLCLTVANQYIAQMTQEVRDAVFGNVGSTVAFRMGADDARVMQRYFEPKFEEHDLVHMHNRNFVISMTIGGEKVQAFSATSLNLPPKVDNGQLDAIIAHSRQNYSKHITHIEEYVQDRYVINQTKPSVKMNPEPKPSLVPDFETAPEIRTDKPKADPSVLGSVVVPTLATEEPVKKKRKRTRRRKKKSNETIQTSNGQHAEDDTGHISGDGTIQLR